MTQERPYLQYSSSELLRLARENTDSPEILEAIEYELAKHRRTGFAGYVLSEVRVYLAKLRRHDVFFPTEEPLEIPFLLPDESIGERWIGSQELAQLEERFLSFQPNFDIDALTDYAYDCRVEIQRKRRYQIPSQGNAELQASERLLELFDLRAIRFVQEGAEPPAVYQRFEFGDPPAIGIIRVNARMSVEGFYEFNEHEQLRVTFPAIALGYFRDLVVPVAENSTTRRPRYHRSMRNGKSRNRKKHARTLPRTPDYVPQRIEEWHQVREKEKHSVVGHMRWISRDFIADEERQRLCLDAIGRRLPPGYTWVREHERGSVDPGIIEVRRSDLTRRTRFLPPKRATEELDDLLR